MNQQQTAALLAVATTYWPNINRHADTAAMVSAWAKSMQDVPYKSAERAIVELSRKCDFPPSLKMVVDEASKHATYKPEINWSMLTVTRARRPRHRASKRRSKARKPPLTC